MKILQVGDRPGWAIDRLSKPLSELYDNVDMSYFSVSPNRYLDSGYSHWKTSTHFTQELGEQYDVIHFHRVKACLFDFDKMRAKRIITVHTERHEDWEDKKLLDFDIVIAPTKHAREHCLKSFPQLEKKIINIPHGIDLERYSSVKNRINNGTIGYVGRIVKWKRWGIIQKAVSLVGLKVVGCGYIEIGKLFNVHNLKEGKDWEYNIFYPEKLMPVFYSKLKLFINISEPHIEAGPLPIMEAMACGVPVISTKVGWAKDWCEHNKNILFVEQDDAEDPVKLSKIIKEAHDNESLLERISKGGLELIKDFGIKTYAERLMKIYELY